MDAQKLSGFESSARPSAITHSMLALCSASFKALRFASTALARGLRALTPPPRSSATGNYVMADDECPLRRAGMRISGRIRTHGFRKSTAPIRPIRHGTQAGRV